MSKGALIPHGNVRSVIAAVGEGEFLTSLDLTEAYLNISIWAEPAVPKICGTHGTFPVSGTSLRVSNCTTNVHKCGDDGGAMTGSYCTWMISSSMQSQRPKACRSRREWSRT